MEIILLNKIRAMIFALIFSMSGVAHAATAIPSQAKPGQLIIHTLDVGHADSILVQLPNSETMLIDAGGIEDSAFVAGYIAAAGINKINYLIATHPHDDHIGGMATVINAFDIEKMYMPAVTADTEAFANLLLAAIDVNGLKINTAFAGVNLFQHENLQADFVAPNSDSYSGLNDYSAVIKLTYGETSFLLTGDAEVTSEIEILSEEYDITSNVLKVGHHGGETATTEDFLAAVKPAYAIISCGKNVYGHPARETLKRLAQNNIIVFRTDLNGTVVIISDSKDIAIVSGKK